jgi:hypothetical protein
MLLCPFDFLIFLSVLPSFSFSVYFPFNVLIFFAQLFFHFHLLHSLLFISFLPSSRTMVLASTQPLTEMSTRYLPGGKVGPAREADNLTAICEPIVLKMWESQRFTTLQAFMSCYRDSFTSFDIPPSPN